MSDPKKIRLQSPAPGSVRWTEGFWADKFDMVKDVTLPRIRAALDVPENGAVFRNLYVAAGLQEGEHLGTFWSDGDCYKWMEAATHVYSITRDPEIDAALDELVAVIAAAQDEDGYICTQIQLDPDRERWQLKRHHELYNMGHLMTAAVVHHRVTGKTSFLEIAQKLADYLYDLFQPRPPELTHFGWNPSNIMGLVDLYRATGDAHYLELAGIFVDMRGSQPRKGSWAEEDPDDRGSDQNQDRVPLREETTAVGHAVTATYLYCGATDLYAETGDETLMAALERIWENLIHHKMYITGAVGAHHRSVSRRGDKVHESFGRNDQLPNATAYNETCANIGNGMWNRRMLQVTGDAKYADAMERVIYNSGLSGISSDGRNFCYTNPLRWYGPKQELLSHDTPSRWFTHNCYCCPPQVTREIAWMQNWAYGLSEEGLWLHIYGGSEIDAELEDGTRIKLQQATDYPWDGEVAITVASAPNHAWSLFLRIPGWAEGAEVEVNGETIDPTPVPGEYLHLKRCWSPGDEVHLSLPMDVRLVKANPKVEETRNQVAVIRGPIVYCLESVDLPADAGIMEMYVPPDAAFTPRYVPDLLGGVSVLEGELCRIVETEDDELYRSFGDERRELVQTRLIPYYTWNNRGPTEMTVWLPVCY